MNEACLNLLGQDLSSSKSVEFTARVLDFMKERLLTFQEQTGNLYNLEATPGEGTAYRLARIDQERFEGIRVDNRQATGVPFYTNSTQLPVNFTDDVIQVLDLQEPLQSRYTGGTVLHVFLGEAVPDPQAVKEFVNMVCHNYSLPYFTITPSFSICPEHGYINGEVSECPECQGKTEIYSRVVGYLRPINQWNEGKQAEFSIRKRFSLENG